MLGSVSFILIFKTLCLNTIQRMCRERKSELHRGAD